MTAVTADLAHCLPACAQLLNELFYRLDMFDYERLVTLFEREGSWHRQGEVLHGHEAILQALAKRPRTQRIRHVVTNTFIESQSQGRVRVIAYMLAYRFDDGTQRSGLLSIPGPFRMLTIHAELHEIDGRWQVAELVQTPEFEFTA